MSAKLKVYFFVIFWLSFKIGFSQPIDSSNKRIVTTKILSPCRYINKDFRNTSICISKNDSLIIVFFNALANGESAPIVTKELCNSFINLTDSCDGCIYPLLYSVDSFFGYKANVIGYPSPYSYSLSPIYADFTNLKLMFLFYLENRYFNKFVVGENQIISSIRLVGKRNKDIEPYNYNDLISKYVVKIFGENKKAKSPVKELKIKWVLKLENIHSSWQKHIKE